MATYTYVPVIGGISQGPPGVSLSQPMDATHPLFPIYVDVSSLAAIPPLGYVYANGVFTAPVLPTASATPSQQAAIFLGAGVTVTASNQADAAISGTYQCDQATIVKILGIEVGLLKNGTLPNGAATLAWPDTSGAPHVLTAAQLTVLFTAIQGFVAACDLYAAGHATSLPASTVEVS